MAKEILIVEDDRKVASVYARALESEGYTVCQSQDGAAALEAIAQAPPTLILLDLLLPKRDGRYVLKKLAGEPRTAGIPVIAMSGVFKGKSTERELQKAGARAFLEKPFELEQLIDEVQALIGDAAEGGSEGTTDWSRAQLGDIAAPEFLWRLMDQGQTGAVHFQRGNLHKILLLDRGKPAAIRSNAAAETLGGFMLARKKIDESIYNALKKAAEKGVRHGEALKRMNVLPEEQLQVELRAQGAAKLLELFSWAEGEAWVQEGVTKISYATPLEGWTPQRAILRGAKYLPFERIMAILTPFATFSVEQVDVSLSPQDQRIASIVGVLRALRGPVQVGELLAEHAAPLYALWLIGAVRFRIPGPDEDPGTSPSLRSVPIPETGKQRELQESLNEMRGQTYFQLLGTAPEAEPKEVQSAYLRLAKRYHPDRFASESIAVKAVVSEIFNLLSAARDTLQDPERRAAYQRDLEGGAGPVGVDQVLRAETLCREGEALLKKRDYPGALARFEEACNLDPEEGEFHVLAGWAYFVVHRGTPDGERAAVERLERGIQLAPGSSKGYYYMGQLLKASGRSEKAQKFFAKVLELDPNHVEARQVLRVLRMRESKEDKKSGGGGLFGLGRKKN